jgi:hypothetical protein
MVDDLDTGPCGSNVVSVCKLQPQGETCGSGSHPLVIGAHEASAESNRNAIMVWWHNTLIIGAFFVGEAPNKYIACCIYHAWCKSQRNVYMIPSEVTDLCCLANTQASWKKLLAFTENG